MPKNDAQSERVGTSEIVRLALYLALSVGAYFVFRYGYVSMPKGTWLSYLAFVFLLVVAGATAYRPLQARISAALAPKDENLEWDRELSSKFIAGAGVSVIGVMVFLLCIDHVVHKNAGAGDGGSFLGTFGDFFGGVVNPLLSFITLVAIAFTFGMQRLQLIEARNQAIEQRGALQRGEHQSKLQAFEATFFQMLTLLHSTVEKLHYNSETVLPEILVPSEMPHANQLEVSEGRNVFAGVLATMELGWHSKVRPELQATEIYAVIQREHNYVLGHYFRHMYQILALIERTFPEQEKDPAEWRKSAPKKYSNVLRAQLSANELILLFFNCAGELVDKGQFRDLLKKYEFLEHLPISYDPTTNAIGIRDYDFRVDVKEYLEGTVGAWQAGAFGRNPQLLEALPRLI